MKLSDFDDVTQFTLRTVAQAVQHIRKLGGHATDVVAHREGDYRSWDPETLRVDREAEDIFIESIRQTGWNVVLLSEEAQRVEFSGRGDTLYVISDPFDGSLLYKRGVPAFWFTSLAIYDAEGNPIAAAVGDCLTATIDFCDASKAYTARIADDGSLTDVAPIQPSSVTNLSDAHLETYLMKPKFMYPTVDEYRTLFEKVRFILPNGGPAGFCDTAKGRVDIYFAYRQPHIEIFSGVAIAQRAGCIVTLFDGSPLKFDTDINKRYDVLCCATQELHEQVLELIR